MHETSAQEFVAEPQSSGVELRDVGSGRPRTNTPNPKPQVQGDLLTL